MANPSTWTDKFFGGDGPTGPTGATGPLGPTGPGAATVPSYTAHLATIGDAVTKPILTRSGYALAGDGGGGTYFWDSSSSTGHNGITIVVPTGSSTGRWVLVWDGHTLDANIAGASGAADLGAVLNACDAILPASGGRILSNTNGGALATQAVVGAKHEWVLGAGTHTATTTGTTLNASTYGAPWRVKSGGTLRGFGFATILQESSGLLNPVVISTTSNNAGNIEIQTATATSWITGTAVITSGNSSINAGAPTQFTVTKIDTTHFVLQGSTFSSSASGGNVSDQTSLYTVVADGVPTNITLMLDTDITVQDLKVIGNSASLQSGGPGTIQLGNCRRGTVRNVFLSQTTPNGIVHGGAGNPPATWIQNHSYATTAIGTVVVPPSATGYFYILSQQGTSNNSGSPFHSTDQLDQVITDGTCQWKVGGYSSPNNLGALSGPTSIGGRVLNCILYGTNQQSVVLINGYDYQVLGCRFYGPNVQFGGAATYVDVETNADTDPAIGLLISDNVFDCRTAGPLSANVSGVFIHGGASLANGQNMHGPGLVASNVVLGGNIATQEGMAEGLTAQNVASIDFVGNVIQRVGQAAISLGYPCSRCRVVNNSCLGIGIILSGAVENEVSYNNVWVTDYGNSQLIGIKEQTSTVACSNNRYRKNVVEATAGGANAPLFILQGNAVVDDCIVGGVRASNGIGHGRSVRTVANSVGTPNVTILPTDHVVFVDFTAASGTITLPTANYAMQLGTQNPMNQEFLLVRIDTVVVNTATMATTSAQTIDGAAANTVTLASIVAGSNANKLHVISDQSNWKTAI